MTTHAIAARRPRLLGFTAIAVVGVLVGGCTTAADETTADAADGRPAVTRPAAPEGELPAALQDRLQGALEKVMADYDVPGAAAGVWVPGEGSWTTAVGLADVAGDVAATTDMTWPIRSITKSYTVTMLLQLVDEGKVSLDDTIDQYVDGITDGDQITLLQLANMSSGNADYVGQEFIDDFSADPAKIYTLDELNSFVIGKPAVFAPGSEYRYTNANTNLLGAVIEKVTGQSYADAIEERILGPLGQTGTSYLTDVSDWAGPHPVGYMVTDGVPEAQTENPSILGPAGSLFSTLDDGRVWAQTLATGALLEPRTQELRQIGHAIPRPPYDQYAVGIGVTDGWWGHNGEGVGFTAATFHNVATGASIVVYMNESNVPDAHPADVAFRALAQVLAASDDSGTGAAAAPTLKPLDEAAIVATFEDTARSLGQPGAAMLIRTPQGDITATYGTTSPGGTTPVSLDDHIRVGSNTKTWTGTVILQLVDEGRIALDDPVSTYRPDVPNGENITIEQLLLMRSGLANYTETYELNAALDDQPRRVWDPEELVAMGLALPPDFAPGTGYHYSNTNTVLLGLIAEQLDGKPLAEIFADRLFTPLGLTETSFPATDDNSLPEPHSDGYYWWTNVNTLASSKLPPDLLAAAEAGTFLPNDGTLSNPSWGWSAGSGISTIGDLADWVEALVGKGGVLLSPALQEARMNSFVPISDSPDAPRYGWNLGQFGQFYGHSGELPGFNSFMGYDPVADVTVVVWANLAPAATGVGPASEIAHVVIEQLYSS